MVVQSLAVAQTSDNYQSYKVNKQYGEHSYVSKNLIKHYNQKTNSYNEIDNTKDGTVFTWKKT